MFSESLFQDTKYIFIAVNDSGYNLKPPPDGNTIETISSTWLVKAEKEKTFDFIGVTGKKIKFYIKDIFKDRVIVQSNYKLQKIKSRMSILDYPDKFVVTFDTLKLSTGSSIDTLTQLLTITTDADRLLYFVLDTTNLGDSLFQNSSETKIRLQ